MSSLRDEYLAKNDGDRVLAAADLARALMRGEAESFKSGYSQENAILAARDLFYLTDPEVSGLRDEMEGAE